MNPKKSNFPIYFVLLYYPRDKFTIVFFRLDKKPSADRTLRPFQTKIRNLGAWAQPLRGRAHRAIRSNKNAVFPRLEFGAKPQTPEANPHGDWLKNQAFLFRSYPLRGPNGFAIRPGEFREAKLQEPLLEFGAEPQTPKTKTQSVLVPLARPQTGAFSNKIRRCFSVRLNCC
jgi:hypothetical protein